MLDFRLFTESSLQLSFEIGVGRDEDPRCIFGFEGIFEICFGSEDDDLISVDSLSPFLDLSFPLFGTRVTTADNQGLFSYFSTDSYTQQGFSSSTGQNYVAAFGYFFIDIVGVIDHRFECLGLILSQFSEGFE